MNILGINAYHGDVSAVLVRDGELVAAVEEERFRRIKHVAGFPTESIKACLRMAGLSGADIDARDVDHESTPAQYMVRDRQSVLRYLIERGCWTDLLMASAIGDSELARRHLEQQHQLAQTSDPAAASLAVVEPCTGG